MFKVLDLKQNGIYVVQVLKEDKKTSIVSIIGVLQYLSQGLSKDKYGKIIFMDQKPFEFKETITVSNEYLTDLSFKDTTKIGTEKYYKETLQSSLCIAQYTIYNGIKKDESEGKPANWNLIKIVETLTEHAKYYGFKLINVEE